MSNSIPSNINILSNNAINNLIKLDKNKDNSIEVKELEQEVKLDYKGNLSEEGLVNLRITSKEDIKKISSEHSKHKTDPRGIVFRDNRYHVDKDQKNISYSEINPFISKLKTAFDKDLNKDSVADIKNSIKFMSGFSKAWCKEVLKIVIENPDDAKLFIDKLSKNSNSSILRNGLVLAHTDPTLKLFKGEKKEEFKKFLESYYTDPVLLMGLSQEGENWLNIEGTLKNFSQSITGDTGDGIKPKRFGSCQDIQKRISSGIMKSDRNVKFENYFEIEDYAQLGGIHNFVLIKDKENQKVYKIDPWGSQNLTGSITEIKSESKSEIYGLIEWKTGIITKGKKE